jgi:hypothetical protein
MEVTLPRKRVKPKTFAHSSWLTGWLTNEASYGV